MSARIPYGESLIFEDQDGTDGAILKFEDGRLSVSYINGKTVEF